MSDAGEGRTREAGAKVGATAAVATKAKKLLGRMTVNLNEQSGSAFSIPGVDEALKADAEDRELLAETRVIEVRGGRKLPVTKAELLLERLRLVRELVTGTEDATALRKKALSLQKASEKVLDASLTAILEKQRPLEKSLRELDTFYKQARQGPQDQNLPVYVVNVTGDELRRNDRLFTEFAEQVPKESRFSLDKNIGLMVVPTWLRNEDGLKKFGELARDAKAMLITDLRDFEKVEDATALFKQGGDLQSLKGLDDWKAHVVIAGNHLLVREKHRLEADKLGDLYVSPGMVLAAKIFNGDDSVSMARAQAGDDCKILLETENDVKMRPRWDLQDRTKLEFADCVVPVVNRGQNQWVFWGVETLSSDKFGKQYVVQRVRSFIEKCLIEYLNGRTFTQNTLSNRDKFRDHLELFLRRNSGDQDESKILAGGRILTLAPLKDAAGQDRPDAIDIKLHLNYKFTTKLFVLEVVEKDETYTLTGSDTGWKQEGGR